MGNISILQTDTYQASSPDLIAFFSINGLSPLKIEKNGSRVTFIFPNSIACEKLAKDFYSKKSKVFPLEFSAALRVTKDRIFEELRR